MNVCRIVSKTYNTPFNSVVWRGKSLFISHLNRPTCACVKCIHNSGTSKLRKVVPCSLLKDLRTTPMPSSTRYCSTEDDIIVCHSDLKRLKKTGKVTLIDVRSYDETWRSGTIPGSLCIPLPELERALKMSSEEFQEAYSKKKPNINDEIVFICRRGERSFRAMKQARVMGYEKSKFYQGGFMGWFNQERIRREKKSQTNTEEH